ncbi:MAG: SCP2 sterol-binding domain-containing protein [Lachnospiraceae bacterium]|nr:SCP2 sterol-binding domain-containing protein [Lachnospiraceae bacterium]
MTYEEMFNEIKGKFMGADVSDIHEHLAFQFNIEDAEAGGIFYVEVKDGELHVEPYEYYDRDAIFICAPDVLMKIADGEKDPIAAFTEQKLRVEGNIDKALRLKEIIESKRGAMKEKSVAKKAADKVVKKVAKTVVKKAAEKESKKSK